MHAEVFRTKQIFAKASKTCENLAHPERGACIRNNMCLPAHGGTECEALAEEYTAKNPALDTSEREPPTPEFAKLPDACRGATNDKNELEACANNLSRKQQR
jgi:hypothetical protein